MRLGRLALGCSQLAASPQGPAQTSRLTCNVLSNIAPNASVVAVAAKLAVCTPGPVVKQTKSQRRPAYRHPTAAQLRHNKSAIFVPR